MTFLSPFPPNKSPQHVLRIAYVMPLHSSQTSFAPPSHALPGYRLHYILSNMFTPPPCTPLRHMKKVGGGGWQDIKVLKVN